jgi:FAD/FMN-containing dehydrogenase
MAELPFNIAVKIELTAPLRRDQSRRRSVRRSSRSIGRVDDETEPSIRTVTPEYLSRRDLFRRALAVGTVALGTWGVATSDGLMPPAVGATLVSAPMWRSLAGSLRGTLVLASSPSFGEDRLLYNSRFAHLVPQAIAYCENASDVARCLAFARAHHLPFAARSGGHSYGGYSSSPGLIIDVSVMNTVNVGTRSGLASVGAGAKLIDIYNTLGQHQRLLPGGSCPTVGIAGLTLGGGTGVFARKYGLTCDNLRAVQMVTADSSIVTASQQEHSSLLWASQGGGGGNFAIATNFEFATHPMPPVTLFSLQFPWAAAPAMLHAWQEWMLSAPYELWSNCHVFSVGTSGFEAQVAGVWCGRESDLAALVATFVRSVGATPTYSFQGGDQYLRAMKTEAGCEYLSIAACRLGIRGGAGQLSRSAYAAKSSFVTSAMSQAQVQSYVDAVVRLQGTAPYLGGGLSFDAFGAAINDPAPDATAFVHRGALACIQATYSWSAYSSSQELAAGAAWLSWLGENIFDPTAGAYQNYIDPTLAHWAEAYYGSNLPRLQSIKKSVDPDNVFTFAQSIT